MEECWHLTHLSLHMLLTSLFIRSLSHRANWDCDSVYLCIYIYIHTFLWWIRAIETKIFMCGKKIVCKENWNESIDGIVSSALPLMHSTFHLLIFITMKMPQVNHQRLAFMLRILCIHNFFFRKRLHVWHILLLVE